MRNASSPTMSAYSWASRLSSSFAKLDWRWRICLPVILALFVALAKSDSLISMRQLNSSSSPDIRSMKATRFACCEGVWLISFEKNLRVILYWIYALTLRFIFEKEMALKTRRPTRIRPELINCHCSRAENLSEGLCDSTDITEKQASHKYRESKSHSVARVWTDAWLSLVAYTEVRERDISDTLINLSR